MTAEADPSSSFPRRTGRTLIVTRGLIRFLFKTLTDLDVIGMHHLPPQGSGLLIINHLSNLDPPLVFSTIRREKLTGLVAADYRDKPLERFLIETAGGIWLRRGESDRKALKIALDLLNDDWIIGIAPEGRRSHSGGLEKGKRGPAFLAYYANVPIYPVVVTGTEDWTEPFKRLRRPRIAITFGPPFQMELDPALPHKQRLEQAGEVMMCHLAALLPEQYRGIYRHHPTLEQLLRQEEAPAQPIVH